MLAEIAGLEGLTMTLVLTSDDKWILHKRSRSRCTHPIKRAVIHSELRQSLNSIRSPINLGANHYYPGLQLAGPTVLREWVSDSSTVTVHLCNPLARSRRKEAKKNTRRVSPRQHIHSNAYKYRASVCAHTLAHRSALSSSRLTYSVVIDRSNFVGEMTYFSVPHSAF